MPESAHARPYIVGSACGRWCVGRTPRFRNRRPSECAAGRTYQGHSAPEAQEIARSAQEAFLIWRHVRPTGELMREAAAVLRGRQENFAELMTADMGKTRKEGVAEIEKC